ncbi:RfbB dTDP-D-glucose 4,6-dehydratase [Candidatus Nanopelagicaceae bacterium]
MTSVLITGGAGFIGSEAVRALASSSRFRKIYVVDKLTYAGDLRRIEHELEDPNLEFIESDVNDVESFRNALKDCSAVLHFAAESHVDRSISNGSPFISSNIAGTYSLLSATREFPSIRTVVVSTDEVYGSVVSGEANEESAINPSSIYSASKAAADLLAMAQVSTYRQDLVITRCCNNYGPWQDSEKVIPTFIANILTGNSIPVYGSGENVREWIHVRDHVAGILLALEKGASGEIYNIGTGLRFSNLELADKLLSFDASSSSEVKHVDDRLGHDFRYAISSRKITQDLGWSPMVGFELGLRETFEWYRDNFSWFGGAI